MMDANMSWSSHLAMFSKKLSRINGTLYRLKYLYPQNILITLYKSLFIPNINYGSCFRDMLINLLLLVLLLFYYFRQWQSIKHVTSNKYTQSHLHYTGLFDIENAIPPFSDR